MTYGITGFGAYVPRLRMDRGAIAESHSWMAPGLRAVAKGTRAFSSWDEDAVTMAVEAARDAVAPARRQAVDTLWLTSTTLPYADLQSSSIVASALALRPQIRTLDLGASQRAATSGLMQAMASRLPNLLLVASERPLARPASTQEMLQGAGAAAFTLGNEGIVAQFLGAASEAAVFIDHFRAAGQSYEYAWEERWIRDEGYMRIVPRVAAQALQSAGLDAGDIQHLVMPSPIKGVVPAIARALGFAGTIADPLDDGCGYTGAAHALLMLAATLERAGPNENILLLGFGQGCDALVLRTTDALADARPQRGVTGSLAQGIHTKDYLRMLAFHGGIQPEWGMRAERDTKTALTELYRSAGQITSFQAGACPACGTVQFPQLAFCVKPGCGTASRQFEQLSLIDQPARVLTHTADWLSYYPSPPLYVGFVQFDVGARLSMEIVDVGPGGIEVGTPLSMVFRIKEHDEQRGLSRYFWKATPANAG